MCGKFGNIFLLSAKTKECLGSLKMNGEVNGISFNSDGSTLFSHGGKWSTVLKFSFKHSK